MTEMWGHLPAAPQTTADTGSYFDTGWTTSTLDCAGTQPGVMKHYDKLD